MCISDINVTQEWMTQCMTQAINIKDLFLERIVLAMQWWCMSVFPALMWQAGESLSWRQPVLQIEFQDSQGYTEKPCLKKKFNANKERVLFFDEMLGSGKLKLPLTDDRYQTTPGGKKKQKHKGIDVEHYYY